MSSVEPPSSEAAARRKQRRTFHIVRWGVLLSVLAASTIIGLLHQKAPELRIVAVDALCPFGGLESLWSLMSAGIFIKRVAWGSVVLLVGAIGTNLLLGRAFCGQFCPLGVFQDIFSKVRDLFGMRRMSVPTWLDEPARFLKYAVLGVFTWLAWMFGQLVIRPYDPWVAYHHLTSGELFGSFGVGAAILLASVAGSALYDRFFCKYLCPMGAFLGLFSRASFFRPTRRAGACIDCKACDRACPVNIEVSTVDTAVKDAECIACGECVASCPKAAALSFDGRNESASSISPLALTLYTLAIMLGLVVLTTATGLMSFTK